MRGHAGQGELALYVQGALEGARAALVEAHCVSCDACAAGLAREASLEVAFEQIARRASRLPSRRSARAAACGAAGLVAMAAAAVLWLGRAPVGAGEGSSAATGGEQASMLDGATLDARHDALDGG